MKGEAPVYKHLKKCRAETRVTVEQMEVLASTTRSEKYLFTLEALWQKEERPGINTGTYALAGLVWPISLALLLFLISKQLLARAGR